MDSERSNGFDVDYFNAAYAELKRKLAIPMDYGKVTTVNSIICELIDSLNETHANNGKPLLGHPDNNVVTKWSEDGGFQRLIAYMENMGLIELPPNHHLNLRNLELIVVKLGYNIFTPDINVFCNEFEHLDSGARSSPVDANTGSRPSNNVASVNSSKLLTEYRSLLSKLQIPMNETKKDTAVSFIYELIDSLNETRETNGEPLLDHPDNNVVARWSERSGFAHLIGYMENMGLIKKPPAHDFDLRNLRRLVVKLGFNVYASRIDAFLNGATGRDNSNAQRTSDSLAPRPAVKRPADGDIAQPAAKKARVLPSRNLRSAWASFKSDSLSLSNWGPRQAAGCYAYLTYVIVTKNHQNGSSIQLPSEFDKDKWNQKEGFFTVLKFMEDRALLCIPPHCDNLDVRLVVELLDLLKETDKAQLVNKFQAKHQPDLRDPAVIVSTTTCWDTDSFPYNLRVLVEWRKICYVLAFSLNEDQAKQCMQYIEEQIKIKNQQSGRNIRLPDLFDKAVWAGAGGFAAVLDFVHGRTLISLPPDDRVFDIHRVAELLKLLNEPDKANLVDMLQAKLAHQT